MELLSYFKDAGWSAARVRYDDDELTDALTEWGGDSDAARCKAAYLLLRHSFQALSRRSRMALVASSKDGGGGFSSGLCQTAFVPTCQIVPQVRRHPAIGDHYTQGGRFGGHRARTLGGRKTDTYFQLLGAYGTFLDRQKLEIR